MQAILVRVILAIGFVFLALTILIVAGKAWREAREASRRRRRRELEPRVLAYAHGREPSVLAALGTLPRRRDRQVLEAILLDHLERVRGIERERLARAMDELGFVDAYLARLQSRRWWVRAEAAERLGIAGAERAVDALKRALEDEVSEVRLRAAKALGRLGGATAIRPLLRALNEPNRWSTIRIADILAGMGQDVVDEILQNFPEMNLHAKVAALDILARIRPVQAVPWLRNRLKDPEADVRARACHALGAVGDPQAGDDLIEALRDPEWPVRAMAAKALGRIAFKAAIPALCEALRDREWWVRANAAEALRRMGEPGIEALRRMLDDEDVFARQQAVAMLEAAGVVDREVAALVDEDPGRSAAARRFVEKLVAAGGTGRLGELAAAHPDARVRQVLAGLLGHGTAGGRESAS